MTCVAHKRMNGGVKQFVLAFWHCPFFIIITIRLLSGAEFVDCHHPLRHSVHFHFAPITYFTLFIFIK